MQGWQIAGKCHNNGSLYGLNSLPLGYELKCFCVWLGRCFVSRCSSERVLFWYFTVLTFACFERKPICKAYLLVFVFIMNPCSDDCLVRECQERNFSIELLTQTHITKLPKGLFTGVWRLYLEYGLEAFENGLLEVIFENAVLEFYLRTECWR